MSAAEIAAAQPKYRRAGKGFMIPCPAHDDGPDTSCSIWDGENDSIGAKCWARDCSYSDITRALGIRTKTRFNLSDYLVASYQHPDQETHNSFRRDYPRDYDASKPCPWPDCKENNPHKHIWQTKGPPRYNDGCYLLLWGQDDPINTLVIVEGEKAALAAVSAGVNEAGYTPVSWIGGSNRVDYADFSPCFDRNVVLWPDNDESGIKAMRIAAEKVIRAGSFSVAVIPDVSHLPPAGDCADVPSAEVIPLIQSAQEYVPPAAGQQFDLAGNLPPNSTFEADYDYAKSFGAGFGIGDGADELGRIARYEPGRIAATFLENGPRIIVAHAGLWTPLDPMRPQPTGSLQIIGGEAREKALRDATALDPTNRLLRLIAEHFQKNTRTSFWLEVMRQSNMVALQPPQHNVVQVNAADVDRRDKALLFPLRNGQSPGSAWTFDGAGEIDAPAVRSCYLLDHQWEGAAPRFDFFDPNLNPTPNCMNDVLIDYNGKTLEGKQANDVILNPQSGYPSEGAAVMNWFIHEHIGAPFFQRVAYLLVCPRKQLDCLIIKPDTGKGTLFFALEMALGKLSVTISKGTAFLESDRFTNGINFLAQAALVIADEADKLNGKSFPAGMINHVADDYIALHLKGKDVFNARRTGNLIFVGNDWPSVDFNQPGVDSRIPHAWKVDTAVPISWQTRARLLTEDAVGFLAAYLLQESVALHMTGNDGITQAGRDFKEEWREAVASPAAMALRAVAEEIEGAFVAGADLRKAVEAESGSKAPQGIAWHNLIVRFFPTAVAVRNRRIGKRVTTGYDNIALIPNDDTPV